MKMYIDPGTGSMLFAILIGIIGVANYLLKSWIVKLRFLLHGGKKLEGENEKTPFVIFSDNKRYWNIFNPICRELDRRGIDVVYMTASPDDPALECPYEHVKGEFIGEGNRAFAKLNFLKADMVFSTTPGLDVYQWKRSKEVSCYVHILHAPCEVTLYRMFGIDYYDAVLLSGQYQADDIREMEKMRSLPEKELAIVGVPYIDEMAARLAADGPVEEHERTVLLAPSWGESGILKKYGAKFIKRLVDTGYNIIIRPHPQSFTSEKDMIDALMSEFPESEKLHWNRDNDNYEVLRHSDIMISEFSGVVFDFALVFDKPVIYADTEFDTSPYDAWWFDKECWTLRTLPKIGQKLTPENFDNIKEMIDTCIDDPRFSEQRSVVRDETWAYRGEGAVRTADWIEAKLEKLRAENAAAAVRKKEVKTVKEGK